MCAPWGPRSPQRSCGATCPVFEEHTVDHDLLVGRRAQPAGLFSIPGLFRRPGAVQGAERGRTTKPPSITWSRPARATSWWTSRSPATGTSTRKPFASACSSGPPRFCSFRTGGTARACSSRDEASIVNLYQSNGFRDVKVTHRLEDDYSGKTGDIAVFLTIDGRAAVLRRGACSGGHRADWTRPPSWRVLSSIAGQPFSEYNVAVDRDAILAQYFENGFPNATFEWSSKPAGAAATAWTCASPSRKAGAVRAPGGHHRPQDHAPQHGEPESRL